MTDTVKTLSGVAIASVKTFGGIAKASIKTWNGISLGTPPGQQAYTTTGTTTFVVPAGVTKISVVCVGAGYSVGTNVQSAGGALAYVNNISVTPGESLDVRVPTTSTASAYLKRSGTSLCEAGSGAAGNSRGLVIVGTGGRGGIAYKGGGGAGGYSGDGGQGGNGTAAGSAGAGGGGGGGGGWNNISYPDGALGGGGGGVGLLGEGSSGAGGAKTLGGKGGSSGGDGTGGGGSGTSSSFSVWGGDGGLYGGGSGSNVGGSGSAGTAKQGAVRIIWPGDTRSFPSTNTADM